MHTEPNLMGTTSDPGEPTNAPPGSERKIDILTERAARREALFHPHDYLVKKENSGRMVSSQMRMQHMESA